MGQYPRHNTSIDGRLLPLLRDQRLYYRRGRECEDEGFGLGAAAYYRRVVESIIDKVLDELQDLVPEQDRRAYLSALDRVKGDRRAVEKIDAVSDLMPESLWLKGQNPLKLLHSVLSENLHSRDENEILALSEDTRTLLDYLLIEISEKRNRALDTAGALERLLKRTDSQK